jgi:hypothetical protein
MGAKRFTVRLLVWISRSSPATCSIAWFQRASSLATVSATSARTAVRNSCRNRWAVDFTALSDSPWRKAMSS